MRRALTPRRDTDMATSTWSVYSLTFNVCSNTVNSERSSSVKRNGMYLTRSFKVAANDDDAEPLVVSNNEKEEGDDGIVEEEEEM